MIQPRIADQYTSWSRGQSVPELTTSSTLAALERFEPEGYFIGTNVRGGIWSSELVKFCE